MIEPKGTSARVGNGHAELDGIKFETLEVSYGDGLDRDGEYACNVVTVNVSAEIFRSVLRERFIRPGFANEKNPLIVHYGCESDLLTGVRFQNVDGILRMVATIPHVIVSRQKWAPSIVMTATCEQVRWTNERKTLNLTDGCISRGCGRAGEGIDPW